MFRTGRLVGTGLLVTACVGILATMALADANTPEQPKARQTPKPNAVKLQGTINAIKDANQAITAIQFVTDTKTYDVTLTARSLEMGAKLNGKKADVNGFVTEKNGQKWLTVLSYRPAEQK